MTASTRRLPSFEPFRVHPPIGFSEVILRLLLVAAALMFGLGATAMLIGLARAPENAMDLTLPLAIFATLAGLMAFLLTRRFAWFEVDELGIRKRGLAIPNWELCWEDITSRSVGPFEHARVLIGLIPVSLGPYQPLILHHTMGRARVVNLRWRNGDLLHTILREYLEPGSVREQQQRYKESIAAAQLVHERLAPATGSDVELAEPVGRAALHRVSHETPAIRLRLHESLFPDVCCNCLGPVFKRIEVRKSDISMGGILRFLFTHSDRQTVIRVPLCRNCGRRVTRGAIATMVWALLGLFVLGGLLMALPQNDVLFGSFVFLYLVGSVVAVCRNALRPKASHLIRLGRVDYQTGEIEVRIGNPAYARLVAHANKLDYRRAN